jgi:hypothetical protein
MLSAAARRIEPVPPRQRRRWPVLAAGLAIAAGLSAVAAYLLKRHSVGIAPEYTDSAGNSQDRRQARRDGKGRPARRPLMTHIGTAELASSERRP